MEKGLAEGQLQKTNQTHTRIILTRSSASARRKKKKRNQKRLGKQPNSPYNKFIELGAS